MLNKNYWESRYVEQNTGWDIGYASDPLAAYFDQLTQKDLKILIPGAGFGHEAIYLYKQGFTNVTVLDFSASALQNLKTHLPDVPDSQFIEGDFFEHSETHDLVIEQTFFCALDPDLRSDYARHMSQLLKPSGKIVGLLFNFPLTEKGPPFGGSLSEYQKLFSEVFTIKKLEPCYNSIKPRQGNELFFIFESKQQPAN
ncbi:methyltransferase domain-containing protein [Leeuwenhoekiella sp. MAR_2009_132]|uniref:methyltransferase domain-containing protein n=1 Tax=Leeuwenhoekiella sp. MAR_2009_132 TaxID=1392489 RepID=UPI001F45519B|nr:methyltransferase domain-containing protein [Leeuwenhoekiella sp. MAR_2009_132]